MSCKSNLNVQIQGFKYKSYLKVFPLQQNAFDFIDDMDDGDQVKDEGSKKGDDQLDKEADTESRQEEVDTESRQEEDDCRLLFSLERRLFAFEYNDKGKRRYVVSHLGRFMQEYWMEMKASERNYYELIREGTPCRLYFDLEYNKLANPNITNEENEALLDEFIVQLAVEIKAVYDIAISRKNIVDLDSSTKKKFSRHFIIHFPNGELFADAPTCGIFVKNFIGRLAEEVATGAMSKKHPTLAKYLFVQNKPTKVCDENDNKENCNNEANPKVCFVDTGVYTRNRVFRILGSVKYGKPPSAALRLASTNQYPFPINFKNDLFYDSKDNESDSDYCWDNDFESEESFWESHALALSDTLIVPLQNQINNSEILPVIKATTDALNEESVLKLQNVGRRKNRSNKSIFGPSPFPLLDEFVGKNLATRKGLNGSIRSWSLDNGQMTYFMKDNRWCENIQRSHKSNNIMWNISTTEGMYWQTCLDPECKFRGIQKDLPSDVKQSLNDYLLDQAINVDEDFEKALMELQLDPIQKCDDTTTSNRNDESNYDVDDEFNEALLNLTLSDSNKLDTEEIANSGKNVCQKQDDQTESFSCEKFGKDLSSNHEQFLEESFDSEFAIALMKELAINSSSCG